MVRSEFTYAYVNHISQSMAAQSAAKMTGSDKELTKRDYSLMICYDHRINPDFQ